ncbi:TPR domain-containing protein, partial [Pseudomonas coronafaciens pv. oryzae]
MSRRTHRITKQVRKGMADKASRIPHSGQHAIRPATVQVLLTRASCMNFLRPTLLTLACLFSTHGMADDLPSLGDASSSIVSPEQEHRLGRAWLG